MELTNAQLNLWLDAYNAVNERLTQVVNALNRFGKSALDPLTAERAFRKLPGILQQIAGSKPPPHELVHLARALQIIDDSQSKLPGNVLRKMVVVERNNTRYVLVPAHRHLIGLSGDGVRGSSFRTHTTMGAWSAIGLRHRWILWPEKYALDWSFTSAVGIKPEEHIRVGFVERKHSEDLRFHIASTPGFGPLHRRVAVRCDGHGDPMAAQRQIEQTLRLAYEENVQMLLFPELLISQPLLLAMRSWMRKHNVIDPRIRVVIAGSAHVMHDEAGEGDGNESKVYSNRLTALRSNGETLWIQNKLGMSTATTSILKLSSFPSDRVEYTHQLGELPPDSSVESYEPTYVDNRIKVIETLAGRFVSPICIDSHQRDTFEAFKSLWPTLVLVPAMDPSMHRFESAAQAYSAESRASTMVANVLPPGAVLPSDSAQRRHLRVPTHKASIGPEHFVSLEVDNDVTISVAVLMSREASDEAPAGR